MSTHRVLLVDDDPSVLNAFRRQLHSLYSIETCVAPEQALELLKSSDGFQVVVSDMQMPTMNGLDFLKQCREVSPHTIRIMLTGNGDQATVVNAINEGAVFRFLLKPCESAELIKTLADAIKTYQDAAAERDAVADAQCSALKLLTDVMSAVRPSTFKHSIEARKLAAEIAKELKLPDARIIEMAALLSYCGSISLPEALFERYLQNQELSAKERVEIERFVEMGRSMISAFPSFDDSCLLLAHQLDAPISVTPLGSRILRVTNDYLRFCRSSNRYDSIEKLSKQPAIYDKELVLVLKRVIGKRFQEQEISIADLKPGYVLMQPIRTSDGVTLIESKQQVTTRILERLQEIVGARRISPSARIRVIPEVLAG